MPKPSGNRPSYAATAAAARNLAYAKKRSGTAMLAPAPAPVSQTATVGQPVLRFIPLGGVSEIGRTMNILEFGNDAIVVDAGLKLGVDLPGINYALPDFSYLESIKSKLRAYIFTHGHLDHIGAMPFLLSKYPAPCFGSRFTLDMLDRIMLDRDPNSRVDKRLLNPDTHEKVTIGPFKIELVRVNHSIPDSCAMVIDTPVGRVVDTGDFKFDPDPPDGKNADKTRLKQLGDEGVLLLLSDSSNCEEEGRVLSEKSLIPTLESLVRAAPGRVVASAVSTNINRTQILVDIMVKAGRRFAIDGRSMLANVELAVRNGYISIPKGSLVAMRDIGRVPDKQLGIISTGHQGELGSVLMRMASGEHKFVKLKNTDTVIFSASPIPGNEKAVEAVVDRLLKEGVRVFEHRTHKLEKIGPLHVSGHAKREELAEMISLLRPKCFIPIHGYFHHQVQHQRLAIAGGVAPANTFAPDVGEVYELDGTKIAKTGKVPAGTQLVDQNGEVIPGLVIQDRLLMSRDGLVVVVLTLDKRSGAVLSSPDIVARGFVHVKESEALINDLRDHLKEFAARRFGKVDVLRFKQEAKDDLHDFLYRRTNRTPVVIPVINIVDPAHPVR